MKALIHLDQANRKQLERRAHEAVMKERADIAMRSLYLVLLACYQVGLSPRTLRKIQDALPVVTKRYSDYRIDQLADNWAHITLQGIGVDVPETESKL